MKLKLIESTKTPEVGDLIMYADGSLDILTKSGVEHFDDFEAAIIVLPYGISDEQPQVGDIFYADEYHPIGETISVIQGNFANGFIYSQLRKVVIKPEQFDYKQIVELGLKDGDEIEINGGAFGAKVSIIYVKKVDTNLGPFEPTHFNTDIPNWRKPVYTEEEVIDYIEKYLLTKAPNIYSNTTRTSLKIWFEQNKK